MYKSRNFSKWIYNTKLFQVVRKWLGMTDEIIQTRERLNQLNRLVEFYNDVKYIVDGKEPDESIRIQKFIDTYNKLLNKTAPLYKDNNEIGELELVEMETDETKRSAMLVIKMELGQLITIIRGENDLVKLQDKIKEFNDLKEQKEKGWPGRIAKNE